MKRFTGVRIPQNLYQEIQAEASRLGLSVSANIVRRLEQHNALLQNQIGHEKILAKLEQMPSARGELDSYNQEMSPAVLETLYLLRELIAERSPQILKRVGEKMGRIFDKK